MDVLSEEDFYISCDIGCCLRNTFITDNCLKLYKRKNCYNKYIKKEEEKIQKEKNFIDYKWIEVCNIVDERDIKCIIWNKVLTQEEKQLVIEMHKEDFFLPKSQILGHAHIISRARSKELYYDPNNIFLCMWFFHYRYDNNKDLVLGCSIDKEKKEWWTNRIKESIGLFGDKNI